MEDRARALGELAWDVLNRIVRDRIARKAGGHLVEGTIDAIELPLQLPWKPGAADPGEFADRLIATIDGILDDRVQHAAAFRPGHAFCHRCATAACEHSYPPSARHVFVGYRPTGAPRWEDFAQHCLELRHPEVDRLFSDPPAFVTLVHDARALRGGMVEAFAAGSYELLGQLCAGFFPVRTRIEEGRGVLALTIQVASSRGARGGERLGLNLLGRAPSGEELGMLWGRHEDLPWRGAVRWAQSALVTLAAAPKRRVKLTGGDLGPEQTAQRAIRIEGILHGLARRLERDLRARSRRTGHAQARHDSGERPTRMAVNDAGAAAEEAILVDERNGTLVVLGERGRTHFFTREGRLVTSVRYNRESIDRKRKLGLWRDATAQEAEGLRGRVAGREGDPRL